MTWGRILRSAPATYILVMGGALLLTVVLKPHTNVINQGKYFFLILGVAAGYCATKGYVCGLAASLTWWALIRKVLDPDDFEWRSLSAEAGRLAFQVAVPLMISYIIRIKAEAKRREKEILTGLVTGMSHRFNNLLIVIMGNASLLQKDSGSSPATQEKLMTIIEAAEEAAALVQQLRTHARQGFVTPAIQQSYREIQESTGAQSL